VSYWRPSVAVLAAGAALLLLGGAASAASPTLQLVVAASGFSKPTYVTSTSADPTAIYVVEQRGRVWRVVDGVTDPRPFLDISSNVHSAAELGLFSIAFSPTYATDHLVYAYYINKKVRVTVSRFKVIGPSAKVTTLLTVQSRYHDHNGGQIAFGRGAKLHDRDDTQRSATETTSCRTIATAAQTPTSSTSRLHHLSPIIRRSSAPAGSRRPCCCRCAAA